MVVAVLSTTSLLGFLSDLDLLDGIVLRRARSLFFCGFCFVLFCFVSLEEGLCPFLKFNF